ncbi:MAG: hypothetical protein QOE47_298 [Pyrinomonadaceae bacterium]|nr:hypothetical protein [Pyrinomonadaceae bacterium]
MAEDQILLRQYLLGELEEEAQHSVEERLFTRREYLDEMLIAEDELIDSYLSGSLSGREAEDFTRHFLLTPERRLKLRFARSLKKYVSTAEDERSPEPVNVAATEFAKRRSWTPAFLQHLRPAGYAPLLLAAALVLLVAYGSWSLILFQQQQQQRAELEAELIALNRQPVQGAETTPATTPPNVAALILTQGQVRSGSDLRKVVLDENVRGVQLRFDLPSDDFRSYQAVLQLDGDERLIKIGGLRPRAEGDARVIVLNLPATLLAEGDYQLLLKGAGEAGGATEDVATYRFRVTGKTSP